MKAGFRVFLGFWLFYSVMGAGYLDTVDAEPSLETARALLQTGSWEVHPENAYSLVYRRRAGTDPKRGWITKMGMGMPLVYVPMVKLGQTLAKLTGWNPDTTERFAVANFNAIITALIVTLFSFLWARPGGLKVEYLLTLGTATLLLPYAKTCHREPLLALLFTALAVSCRKKRDFWAGGFIAAIGLVKSWMIFAAFPFVIYRCRSRPSGREILRFIFFPVIALWAQLQFQIKYLGGWDETGYSSAVTHLGGASWSTPVLTGVWKQVFSLESGLLFYCPVLLVIAGVAFRRPWDTEASFRKAVALTIGVMILLHARWFDPSGGDALGPRYLLPAIPLFFLLLPEPAEIHWPLSRRVLVGCFIFLAIGQQLLNTAVKAQQYGALRARASKELTLPHWMANGIFARWKWQGEREIYPTALFGADDPDETIDLSDAKSLRGFNFWWLHARKPEMVSRLTPPQNPHP